MKIRASKRAYYSTIALCVALPLLCVLVFSAGASFFSIAILISSFASLIFFLFTMGRSVLCVLTIDEQGVTARYLGKKVGSLRWDEMAEVGVGMQGFGSKGKHYLYFVRYYLNEMERHMIQRMVQNNSALWVELTKQSLEAVTKYYTGYIHQMELML